MRLKMVGSIYKKEMLDLTRDRRTLISMVVVPVLLMPVLMIAGGRMIDVIEQRSKEEAKTMTVAFHSATPEIEALLRSDGLKLDVVQEVRAAVEQKKSIAGVEEVAGTPPEFRIYTDASNPTSAGVADKIRLLLSDRKEQQVKAKLRAVGVAESVLTPFAVKRVNIASERKMAGMVWGSMLGYLLLLLMFSGGMYPVIDMTAGEKERKTLETFLSSPAGRDEIVLGKMLAAMTAIGMTAALTLGSVVFSVKNGNIGVKSPEVRAMFSTIPLDGGTVSLIALTLIPLIVFAASTMLAIAVFARSFKEGQSYLTPLMMFVLFPALLGGLPGLELTPVLCLIPIFNASQLIRLILLGEFPVNSFAITLAANAAYAVVAFVIAKRRFEDEAVLFRS